MSLPSLVQFTRATLNVLRTNGIAEYLPTIAVDGDFYVIDGIPEDVDHRKALKESIARDALMKQDFLFAVRSGATEITVAEYFAGEFEFVIIRLLDDGFHQAPLAVCEWWEEK
jgi:hypothetical protein